MDSPELLRELRDLIERGGFLSIFDRSVVPRSKALELIDRLIACMPEEMLEAIEIVNERQKVLAEAEQKARDIVDEAVKRAEKLVSVDAITLAAESKAKELQAKADEYVIDRLSKLASELERLLEEVRNGIVALGGELELEDEE